MGILDAIVARKKERLAAAQYRTPLQELKARLKDAEEPRDFRSAISRGNGPIRLVAEIKKASPSKGLIRTNFDHCEIARIYDQEGVDAMSVLTEEDFFQGGLEFLADVRKVTARPLLRKDFIISEYQIYEARACAADAILLIAAILEIPQAGEYLHLARELGVTVLFEVHDRAELEMAIRIGAPVIGINNRNLKTLSIDLHTSLALIKEIPPDCTTVTESGIKTRDDVVLLDKAGLDAMLVGTVFMESSDIAAKVGELRGKK